MGGKQGRGRGALTLKLQSCISIMTSEAKTEKNLGKWDKKEGVRLQQSAGQTQVRETINTVVLHLCHVQI